MCKGRPVVASVTLHKRFSYDKGAGYVDNSQQRYRAVHLHGGPPGTFGVRFHNHLYQQLGTDFYYKAMRTDDLPAAVAGIRALEIRGCGVSMPYKEACMATVDEIDPSAAAIESVNTWSIPMATSRPTTPITWPCASC